MGQRILETAQLPLFRVNIKNGEKAAAVISYLRSAEPNQFGGSYSVEGIQSVMK